MFWMSSDGDIMNLKRVNKACLSLKHCITCRNDVRQQKAIGFPEICPYGYTKDNLPAEKKNTRNDKCKFAVPDCCGKPHICSCTMGDCPDHFDKNCKIRLKYKG